MSFLTGLGVVVIVDDFPLTCGVVGEDEEDDEKTTEAMALRGDWTELLKDEVDAIPSSVTSSSRAINTGLCNTVPNPTSSPAFLLFKKIQKITIINRYLLPSQKSNIQFENRKKKKARRFFLSLSDNR